MKSRLRPLVLLSLLAASVTCQAQRIALADLGELEIGYAEAQAQSEYPGAQLLLSAQVLPGDAFALRLPFRPNRITRLVGAGTAVSAGTAIVRIEGPELAAWLLEAEAVEAQFAQAQARFRSNEILFAGGGLSAAQWKTISEAYYLMQREMHHVEHVREVLRMDATVGELARADVLAPVDGRVIYPDGSVSTDAELLLANFVADDALRLTGRLGVGSGLAVDPVALIIGDCRIDIAQVEATAQALTRRVWSAAAPACIDLIPGAAYAGRALYPFDGVAVPRGALLRHGGLAGVLVRRGQALEFVAAQIVAEEETHYYLEPDSSLAGAQVLSRSVSAVQGMLLGLGSN
ncbi:MAG: hypothetical protein V2I82_00670 [Halieaceae bacterium]|jgi:hypothetical protein|nr:hypothetical protein [Halieaceae bacterium]